MNMPRATLQNSNMDESEYVIRNGVLTKYSGSRYTVVIPEGVREISSSAFMGCRDIGKLVIPDSVTCIDRYSFVSCTSLKHVTLGFGIKEIPMGCFSALPALETVIMCDVIETIDDYAFSNCKALKSITFKSKKYRDPVTAEEKGKAFELMLSGKPEKIEYVDVADVVPAIRRIGNYAFYGCTQIDFIELKSRAVEIGLDSFPELEQNNDSAAEDQTIQDNEFESDAAPVPLNDEANSTDSSNDYHDKFTVNAADIVDTFAETEASIDEQELNDNAFTDTETDIHKEYLIAGFEIVDNSIKCIATGEIIPDALIATLNLSVKTYNCLYRAKKTIAKPPHTDAMVSDVLSMSEDDLMKVHNMGAESAKAVGKEVASSDDADAIAAAIGLENSHVLQDIPGLNVRYAVKESCESLSIYLALICTDSNSYPAQIFFNNASGIDADQIVTGLLNSVRLESKPTA